MEVATQKERIIKLGHNLIRWLIPALIYFDQEALVTEMPYSEILQVEAIVVQKHLWTG